MVQATPLQEQQLLDGIKEVNMSKDIYGDFYNPTRLISTGKPYLFSIGVRSSGKSTGWLIHLLKEYMRYDKQFIYLRRDKEDRVHPDAPYLFLYI